MFNSNPPYAGYFSNAEYPIIEAIHNRDKEALQKMMAGSEQKISRQPCL